MTPLPLYSRTSSKAEFPTPLRVRAAIACAAVGGRRERAVEGSVPWLG
jgi:hypothetical protein